MGLCEERVHGNQYGKFLRHYGSREAPSCLLQVTLARWAVLFSVIIIPVARMIQRWRWHRLSRVTIIFNIFYLMLYFIPRSFVIPCTFDLPTFVLINTMSCHVYRNVRLSMYREHALASSPSDQLHQFGIAFSPMASGHSTILTQGIDLEAARDSNFASREKVDAVGLDKAESKKSIIEKGEV